jgi:hypothetical protein
MIFVDDVSGNVSKQWNKHFVSYSSNTSLPREYLDKERNIRFVSASPNVNPMELFQGIRESFECVSLFFSLANFDFISHRSASNPGVICYDSILRTECISRPIPYIWAGDNPMQAEACSHTGLTSNKFCRTCFVGGTQEFKRSNEGYMSLFKVMLYLL